MKQTNLEKMICKIINMILYVVEILGIVIVKFMDQHDYIKMEYFHHKYFHHRIKNKYSYSMMFM